MSTKPHIPYHKELMDSLTTGGDMMADMVRGSIFQAGTLPPPDIFEWYVLNSAYRFVAKRALFTAGVVEEEEYLASKEELDAVGIILEKQKQLTLIHKVAEIMRVSELSVDA